MAELMLDSAQKLAAAGADFLTLDDTNSPLPTLAKAAEGAGDGHGGGTGV